jgi:ParB family chromosome partitioning protein
MSRPRKTSGRATEGPEMALGARQSIHNGIIHQVPIAKIRTSHQNPRLRLGRIDELAAGILDHQHLQPVVVRRASRGYELIAGKRRLEAVKTLGWTEIPALLQDEMNPQAYVQTLVENLQREDLTPTEEASALRVLVRDRGWTTHQVGAAIRRSHIFVSRRLRVFEDPVLASLVTQIGLPLTTVEELLRATDPDTRRRLAAEAAQANWTPSEARKAVANAKRNNLPQDDRLDNDLKALGQEVLHLDPEHIAPSTLTEARNLIRALQRLIKRSPRPPRE